VTDFSCTTSFVDSLKTRHRASTATDALAAALADELAAALDAAFAAVLAAALDAALAAALAAASFRKMKNSLARSPVFIYFAFNCHRASSANRILGHC
jgi:hypothetical protein